MSPLRAAELLAATAFARSHFGDVLNVFRVLKVPRLDHSEARFSFNCIKIACLDEKSCLAKWQARGIKRGKKVE